MVGDLMIGLHHIAGDYSITDSCYMHHHTMLLPCLKPELHTFPFIFDV